METNNVEDKPYKTT